MPVSNATTDSQAPPPQRQKSMIPEVSKKMAYFAAVINLFVPGVGTMLAGYKHRGGKNVLAILIGALCLFVGSIGWIVSLYISYCMIKKAISNPENAVVVKSERKPWFSTNQDYKDAADFKKSRFDSIN